MIFRIPKWVLDQTFEHFRRCGAGCRECQTLWTSPWDSPELITAVVHPAHHAHAGGFALEDRWITSFWLELAAARSGIRVQIHTHPGAAFHSPTDDRYPIVHTPGFLSLVIPGFGLGAVGFAGAFLTEIGLNGRWCEQRVESRLRIVT